MKKYESLILDFQSSIIRLEEALAEEKDNKLAIDGTIQRFEFTYELAWKTLKAKFAESGLNLYSPREVYKQAYKEGLLKNEEVWAAMIENHNLTSHTYNQSTAEFVYNQIPDYLAEFKTLIELLTREEK